MTPAEAYGEVNLRTIEPCYISGLVPYTFSCSIQASLPAEACAELIYMIPIYLAWLSIRLPSLFGSHPAQVDSHFLINQLIYNLKHSSTVTKGAWFTRFAPDRLNTQGSTSSLSALA